MASTITIIDVDVAEQTAGTFESCLGDLITAMNNINNSVLDMGGDAWKGTSATLYRGKFMEMYGNLKQTETKVEDMISKLRRAIEIYRETEQEVITLPDSVDDSAGAAPIF